jgi:hypothetical protein
MSLYRSFALAGSERSGNPKGTASTGNKHKEERKKEKKGVFKG